MQIVSRNFETSCVSRHLDKSIISQSSPPLQKISHDSSFGRQISKMAAFLHQLCWRNALTNRFFSVSKHLFPSVNLHRYSLLHAGQERVLSTSVKARELNEDAPRGLPSACSSSSNYNINLRKIYVGNLFKGQTTKENRQIAKDELFKYFSSFGEVELMEFPTKSPRDPSGRGFGFVTFRDVHVAQKVLAVEEPHIIDGQTLKVAPLRNQTE